MPRNWVKCIWMKARKLSQMHSRCAQRRNTIVTLNLSQKGLFGLMNFTPPNWSRAWNEANSTRLARSTTVVMLRHWRIIASARCMQSARICIQQTNITKVCQNDSRYLTLTNHDLCDTITMQSCANSNNALVAYMHWTALCHGWTGCSTPWLCRTHLILSVMIAAKVISAKKVCTTMTSAG